MAPVKHVLLRPTQLGPATEVPSNVSRFGGHALYIKDGKLKYVYNFVGLQEQVVESTQPISTGHAVFSASFAREGDSMPAEGTLTLHVGESKVGEGRLRPSPASSPLAAKAST